MLMLQSQVESTTKYNLPDIVIVLSSKLYKSTLVICILRRCKVFKRTAWMNKGNTCTHTPRNKLYPRTTFQYHLDICKTYTSRVVLKCCPWKKFAAWSKCAGIAFYHSQWSFWCHHNNSEPSKHEQGTSEGVLWYLDPLFQPWSHIIVWKLDLIGIWGVKALGPLSFVQFLNDRYLRCGGAH